MSARADGVSAPERAVIAGLALPGRPRWDLEEALDELERLAESAGAQVVGRFVQRRARPDPATLIGGGKVAELAREIEARGANLAVLEHELTPGQERNLAKALGVKVVDRPELILDIFAQRARTREGRLQVEVAQLTRLLPRLAGRGTELSRLGGGIGTRGPGETKLETDRRRVRERLAALRGRIGDIGRHRALYQRRRRRAPIPVVSLVGYTNAGKSTLLNALTGGGVVAAEDRLFSTLDPTSRRVALPGGATAVVTDTVGFIRHIPPQLVAAFTATLGELHESDLLLHVVDASHPAADEQRETVLGFLGELGLGQRPRLEVWNKIDRLPPGDPLRGGAAPRSGVAISARTGEGIPALLGAVRRLLAGDAGREVSALVPFGRLGALAPLRREGRVLEERSGPEGVHVRLLLDEAREARLRAAGALFDTAPGGN